MESVKNAIRNFLVKIVPCMFVVSAVGRDRREWTNTIKNTRLIDLHTLVWVAYLIGP